MILNNSISYALILYRQGTGSKAAYRQRAPPKQIAAFINSTSFILQSITQIKMEVSQ